MAIFSSNPLFFCLTLVAILLVTGFFPGLRLAKTRLVFGVLYAAPYAALSWIGQSTDPLESHWPLGILSLLVGLVAGYMAYKSMRDVPRLKGAVLVSGMVGLGLLTALFSGPQGGAGKFVYFLEHTLHLSEQAATVVNFVVRKGVHLTVYGSLAASAGLTAGRQGAVKQGVWLAGLSWGLLHSVLDESTQTKTSVRTGTPWDVLLDLVGIVIGLGIVTFVSEQKAARARGQT